MTHVTWAIVLAGGKQQELGPDISIPFVTLNTRPVLVYSLLALEHSPDIEGVIVSADKRRFESIIGMKKLFGLTKLRKLVAASSVQRTSIAHAMNELNDEATLVAVHEASRPCLPVSTIADLVKSAKRYGCAVAGLPIADSVKEVEKGGSKVKKSLDEGRYWAIATPQVFRRELIEKGLSSKTKQAVEDLTVWVQDQRKPVHLVESPETAYRIRRPEDLTMLAPLLQQS